MCSLLKVITKGAESYYCRKSIVLPHAFFLSLFLNTWWHIIRLCYNFFPFWLSLSWRFFFINTHSSTPFFTTTSKECHMCCTHHSYFSHFRLKGNLICFQSALIMNNAVSTHAHASLCGSTKGLLGEIRRSQIAAPSDIHISYFNKYIFNLNRFALWPEENPFFYTLINTIYSQTFQFCQSHFVLFCVHLYAGEAIVLLWWISCLCPLFLFLIDL